MVVETKPKKNTPRFFCPIFNFVVDEEEPKVATITQASERSSFKRFEFVANTTISPLRESDLEAQTSTLIKLMLEEHLAGAFYKYRDLPTLEIYQESNGGVTSLVENMTLALRIFKEGDVFCKVIWSDDHNQLTVLNPTYETPSSIHRGIYSLKLAEINQIREIFEKIVKTDFDKRRQLRIACDRLNRSYGKSMYDEKIVDFMIAFEALFVREKSINAGQIIGTGCSFLLGKTDEERKEMYDFLKEAYRLRNDIVHGSTIDYSEIDQTAFRLKEILRKSILMFL